MTYYKINCPNVMIGIFQFAWIFLFFACNSKNIFTGGELDKNAVVAKNATTAIGGKSYVIEYYNLDVDGIVNG